MAASDKHIGRARCPLCGSDKATVGVSAKGWPYLVAPCCKAQVFARGHESDALIRALLIERAAQAAKPKIENRADLLDAIGGRLDAPVPMPAAPIAAPVETKPAPPAPPKRPAGFGLFGF